MGAGGSNPICTHCSSTKSPLWRRGVHAEILCNACGLYWKHHGSYRPLTLKAAAERKEPRHTDAISAGPGKRESNLRRLKSALGEMVGGSASRRKSKSRDFFGSDFGGAFREGRGNTTGSGGKGSSAGKLNLPSTLFLPCVLTPGRWRGEPVYPPELAPSTGTANVRLVPAEIRGGSSSEAPVLAPLDDILLRSTDQPSKQRRKDKTLKYIMYQGRLLFQGDHVAVRGDDSQIYFAIVHDFWMISSGEKLITLQWLLPKPKYALLIDGPPETIDPAYFALGPIHSQPEPIETIVDVFFSPQRLRRDLEGPAVNLVPSSSSMSASRSSTPVLRRSGSLDWTESDSAVPGSSGHLSLPLPLERKLGKLERRTLSDSEVELHRDVSMDQSLDPCSTMTGSRSVSPIESPVNILDDVEMAHILCSLV